MLQSLECRHPRTETIVEDSRQCITRQGGTEPSYLWFGSKHFTILSHACAYMSTFLSNHIEKRNSEYAKLTGLKTIASLPRVLINWVFDISRSGILDTRSFDAKKLTA